MIGGIDSSEFDLMSHEEGGDKAAGGRAEPDSDVF